MMSKSANMKQRKTQRRNKRKAKRETQHADNGDSDYNGKVWLLNLPGGKYVGAHANPDIEHINAGNLPETKHQYDALLFQATEGEDVDARNRLCALKENEVPQECLLIHAAMMKQVSGDAVH